MKQLIKKTKGIVKGVPSAVLLSALIHLGILFIAGGLVIFTVVKKQEKKFVPPPPVNRPKMDLKKPQPKAKVSSPPAARHIVSKNVNIMSEIQLPDITGISATSVGTGLSGIELVPDLSDLSVVGSKKSISAGNDLVGTFYSFYYDRVGRKLATPEGKIVKEVVKFQRNDWNPMTFAPYYRAPQQLYTTHVFMPPQETEFVPFLFGIPYDLNFRTSTWAVLYTGKIARPNGGRYRFWGYGDHMLLVRVNGELVLNGCFVRLHDEYSPDWKPESPELEFRYELAGNEVYAGNWFELEPGVPVNIEILIGDAADPGGGSKAMLLVEDAKGIYDENKQGMKILPVFKVGEIPELIKDEIKYRLIPGEADLDSELMFNVY